MDVKLRVLEGKNAGQMIPLAGPKFLIGRADDCQLRPRSDLISRHHCVILVEEGFVALRDFGSKNGTYVNDERVQNEQELKNGDRLTVGTLQFEVQLTVSVGGQKKPKVESVEDAVLRSSPPALEDDLNLDDWFGDDDGLGAHADTQTIDLDELLGSQEESKSESSEEDSQDPRKKVVGISEKRAAKITAESSRSAAEEALKNMLRGGVKK